MGLMNRLFSRGAASAEADPSDFAHSITATDETRTRNGPRRDLVKVVLRETLRKHSIPLDWIDCRMLSVLTRQHKPGIHVQFLVRKSDDQLLDYVHAFQESFWQALEKFDPKAREWLFSVGWEFYGKSTRGFAPVPKAPSWDEGDTQPPEDDGDLKSDLQALHAAMTAPAPLR